jgi:phosphoglycolate phosphatase
LKIGAVLFDLDGTLADTAPDLVAVLNEMLHRHGRPPSPFAIARNEVSNGALGLLRLGFGAEYNDETIEALRQEFLEIYTRNVAIKTKIFNGLEDTINDISNYGARWGIVTNKPHAMTTPLLQELALQNAPSCVVSGDQLPQRKPHPAPLLFAADELDLSPENCIYVGDAPRDIEAGLAAGMGTIAVTYGYIRASDDPYSWGADIVISRPAELLDAVKSIEAMRRELHAAG